MRVITGTARGVSLEAPQGMQTRPTYDRVKEGLFNIIQFDIAGQSVLDLFAGSGQLGIECLSRGARRAVFVDEGREAITAVKANLAKTRLTPLASVTQAEAVRFLESCREKFDLIFLDPPYATQLLENTLQRISEIDILTDGGIIITERSIQKMTMPEIQGYARSKDYKYGKSLITLYRK